MMFAAGLLSLNIEKYGRGFAIGPHAADWHFRTRRSHRSHVGFTGRTGGAVAERKQSAGAGFLVSLEIRADRSRRWCKLVQKRSNVPLAWFDVWLASAVRKSSRLRRGAVKKASAVGFRLDAHCRALAAADA